MTVNARSEMDLEEDSILDKVSKASGANFSFHKEKAKPMPAIGPVVSKFEIILTLPHLHSPLSLCLSLPPSLSLSLPPSLSLSYLLLCVHSRDRCIRSPILRLI